MAVPNTYTFSMKNVCAELQITGTTSLNEFFTGLRGAPNISYDITYKGAKTCLRNFRDYNLMYSFTGFTEGITNGGMAYDNNGSMWVTQFTSASIVKITTGGTKTTYTGLGAGTRGVALDGTNMWTANRNDGNVSKITPSGSVSSYNVGTLPIAIAFDGTNMWSVGTCVAKITPAGSVTTWEMPASIPQAIAYHSGTKTMWIADNCNAGGFYKVTSGGTITYYLMDHTVAGGARNPYSITSDGTYIWSANYGDGGLARITPSTGSITCYERIINSEGIGPSGIVYSGTYLWISDECTNRVAKVCINGGVPCNLISYHIPIGDCRPVVVVFDGVRIYAGNNTSKSISVIGAV